MRVLEIGTKGEDVESWQLFLRGQGFYLKDVDGVFGPATAEATKAFQRKYFKSPYDVDGKVGNMTYGQAQVLGFSVIEMKLDYPMPPKDVKPLNDAEKTRLFGEIKYVAAPVPGNPEGIKITNSWQRDNLINVEIPQLKRINGAPANCKILWHKKGEANIVQLFRDWENAGLLKHILSWAGSWNPRFVRGSRTYLSNHALATAFDINAAWNGLNTNPARYGTKGSVMELVDIGYKNGFYWGGNFSRKDGMHFELYKI